MSLDINHYINDGFVKVCKVQHQYSFTFNWEYCDINYDLLYSSHKSWVYAICVDNIIYKLGETGNPLGIAGYYFQPKTGSTSRLGRYMNGDGTDAVIREKLSSEVNAGKVTIWARKCDTILVETQVAGRKVNSLTTVHKDLEMKYLDYIKRTTGKYPELNKCRK
jgi:hypothetical protein